MARYGTWKPIASRSSSALTPDLLGLHTIVGGAAGTWDYFNTGAGGRGVYSHFLVHGKWSSRDTDGAVWQCQDTAYRAAANLDGNWRIISVETADNAPQYPEDIAAWTPAQEDSIVDLMVWAHRTHGIPLVLVPDSKPGRRGICYHRQGCDPFRAAGGELWSAAYGKSCPTDRRIARLPALIERARSIVNGTAGAAPIIPEETLFMALTDAQEQQLYSDTRTLRADVDSLQTEAAKLDRRTNYMHGVLMAVAAKIGAPVPVYDMRTSTAYPAPGDLETIGEEVSRLAVDPAELHTALATVLADLPDVNLTPDAISQVAQSVATYLTSDTDPADPTGV
jgi:hypothetical protein